MGLVVCRKPLEGVQIGEDVQVFVRSVSGNYVKLLIDAPDDKRIQRVTERKAKLKKDQEEEESEG